jgi:hypothetical protein
MSDNLVAEIVPPGAQKGAPVNDVTAFTEAAEGLSATLSAPGGLQGSSLGGVGFTLEPGSLKLLKDGELIATFSGDAGSLALWEMNGGNWLVATAPASREAFGAYLPHYGHPPQVSNIYNPVADEDTFVKHSAQMVLLNAGAVPLEHSTFGGWLWLVNWNSRLYDNVITPYFTAIAGGVSDRREAPAPGGEFIGKAVGTAHVWNGRLGADGDNGRGGRASSEIIFGDARMNVGSLTAATLALDFPGFYLLNFSGINIQPTDSLYYPLGSFGKRYDDSVTVTDQGADRKGFGIDNTSISEMTKVTGQFYGNPGNASEAVGTFHVGSGTIDYESVVPLGSNYTGVTGSFGVKKQP